MPLVLCGGLACAPLMFDVTAIRNDFPILSREVYGKPLVYLDNAASAQKPKAVIDAMMHSMTAEYANVHRGLHFLSNAATQAFEDARESVRRFLNAPSKDQIIFTRNATEAINLVAQSFGGLVIGEGDEIVLSILEHHSNIVPWHFHRERRGAVLRWAPVDDEGNFLLDEFARASGPRTRMVAVTMMSNALGNGGSGWRSHPAGPCQGAFPYWLMRARERSTAMSMCRRWTPIFSSSPATRPMARPALASSMEKPEHLKKMPPYQGGGEMISEVTVEGISYNDPPHRFEAGTPAIVEAIGLGAALDYMRGVGLEAIAAHEKALHDYAMERLSGINALRIYGRAREKGPIISFTMDGAHAHDVATVIDRQGVAVRAGTHCTQPLLQRFGVTATCRASFAMYNTREEVDKLAEALISARRIFG
jgi:cysteine desulfurase/selenocysteine lyase